MAIRGASCGRARPTRRTSGAKCGSHLSNRGRSPWGTAPSLLAAPAPSTCAWRRQRTTWWWWPRQRPWRRRRLGVPLPPRRRRRLTDEAQPPPRQADRHHHRHDAAAEGGKLHRRCDQANHWHNKRRQGRGHKCRAPPRHSAADEDAHRRRRHHRHGGGEQDGRPEANGHKVRVGEAEAVEAVGEGRPRRPVHGGEGLNRRHAAMAATRSWPSVTSTSAASATGMPKPPAKGGLHSG